MRALGALLIGLAALTPLSGCEPPDTTVEDTPVAIVSETIGVGPPVKANDLVTINYRIEMEDGRKIISEEGYRFIVGTGAVIEGIDNAVVGMRVTGQRVISCPPHRRWGRGGYGVEDVPANATLTISLDLEAID
ncbi:MAG: FKBP-type peptidyl-prolyl cis-trans isomerase [Planctomycetota bacterium]|jgi:FKBP-type peptidyl-prolyl cis-trans isomerase